MSTRNISWGVKAAGALGWQPYHLHVPIVLKSWILNLLEPSGPVQACNGIALPLFNLSLLRLQWGVWIQLKRCLQFWLQEASRKLRLQDKTIPKRMIASNPRILYLIVIINMIYVYYCHSQMRYFSTVRCCVMNTITRTYKTYTQDHILAAAWPPLM